MIPNPGASIATRESTGFERALADAEAEFLMGMAAEAVKEVWDPWKISATNLPYLAYGMGANIWEDVWALDTKRGWVEQQWLFQSLRGTLQGIRMALEVNGFDLLEVVAPPGGFMVGADLSKEDMDAWIRLMPQIRVKYAHRSHRVIGDEFYIGLGHLDTHGIGRDDGWELYGRQAVIRYRDGREQDLQVSRWETISGERAATDFEEVLVPGLSTLGFVIGEDHVEDDRYVDVGEIEPQILRFTLEGSYQHEQSVLHLSTVQHGLTPLRPEYERQSDIGDGGPFFHIAADYIADNDLGPQTSGYIGIEDQAALMLADVLYLLDPTVVAPMSEGFSYIGIDRIGVPPYHLELTVDLKGKTPLGEFMVEDGYIDEAWISEQDTRDIERALRAVVAAKATRDKVLVNFAPWRPIEAGDLVAENTLVGAHVRDPL